MPTNSQIAVLFANSLLNAFGNPIDHYGNLDLNLKKNGVAQTGALSELIA